MIIYLVRHAQKDTSEKTTSEDHFNRRLTDVGLRQSEYLAQYFKKKHKLSYLEGRKHIFTVPAQTKVQKYRTVTLTSMYQQVGVCLAEPNVYMKFGWWTDSTYDYVFSGSPIRGCFR